ncbi:hypothetical protein ACLHDG_04485 [Sulfurovum sp. CS9]|uniref:hypothetical protein n=1 Tax=Sulfurovum sp. CS9 TaxID=3391146 RepID=UPI0039EC86DA
MKQLLNKNLKKFLNVLITTLSIPIILYSGDTIRIMPLGDSITYSLPEVGIEAVSYRKDLQDALFNASYSVYIPVVFAQIINHTNNEETNIRQMTSQFNNNLETMVQTRIANGDNIVFYVKGVLYV